MLKEREKRGEALRPSLSVWPRRTDTSLSFSFSLSVHWGRHQPACAALSFRGFSKSLLCADGSVFFDKTIDFFPAGDVVSCERFDQSIWKAKDLSFSSPFGFGGDRRIVMIPDCRVVRPNWGGCVLLILPLLLGVNHWWVPDPRESNGI